MKSQRNILFAFLLNIVFAVFELIGGILTGSTAILSDAFHDLGDAVSIGLSYFLEGKSDRPPDEQYTFGYGRYSVLGGLITTVILMVGSALVICHAVIRIIKPTEIHYNGMIFLAVIGVFVNLAAVFFTRKGKSLNQKAVNLLMLEDVLGWLVVLIGAVVMRFTNFVLIDPILSIGVAVFILIHGIKNLIEVAGIFLEKAPKEPTPNQIRELLEGLDGVVNVHHIHIWSLDGSCTLATMHVVTDRKDENIGQEVRDALRNKGLRHVTIQTESSAEACDEKYCRVDLVRASTHTCHNHHRH